MVVSRKVYDTRDETNETYTCLKSLSVHDLRLLFTIQLQGGDVVVVHLYSNGCRSLPDRRRKQYRQVRETR